MKQKKIGDRTLIQGFTLLFNPELAVIIGLNEAIILQQIHYWVKINAENGNSFAEEHYWTYSSIRAWQEQFPFISERTIQRAISKLVKMDLLYTGCHNKWKQDRTKWYRINYQALKDLLPIPLRQNVQMIDDDNIAERDHDIMNEPLPETYLPNNKIKKRTGSELEVPTFSFYDFKRIINSDSQAVYDDSSLQYMEHFIGIHQRRFGKNKHPKLKSITWKRQLSLMFLVDDQGFEKVLNGQQLVNMIEHYFSKEYQKKCNYSIVHFNHPGIKLINYYEAAYGSTINA